MACEACTQKYHTQCSGGSCDCPWCKEYDQMVENQNKQEYDMVLENEFDD